MYVLVWYGYIWYDVEQVGPEHAAPRVAGPSLPPGWPGTRSWWPHTGSGESCAVQCSAVQCSAVLCSAEVDKEKFGAPIL